MHQSVGGDAGLTVLVDNFHALGGGEGYEGRALASAHQTLNTINATLSSASGCSCG